MKFTFALHRYRAWRFKNTTLLLASLVALVLLLRLDAVHQWLLALGEVGYLGAFVAGTFFVSTFTVAPAGVVLVYLGETLHVPLVALVGGAGAVVGDYVLFRFLKDRVIEEVRPLFRHFGGSYIGRIFATPYFVWLAPVVGALLIASPLPDELGVGLLSGSRINRVQFLLLTYGLNTAGIWLIILVAQRIVE